jgi:hypothetical protein
MEHQNVHRHHPIQVFYVPPISYNSKQAFPYEYSNQ